MSIVLIGFMASGKSTVGKLLSEHLHMPLIEMDQLVLQKTGSKNMHELFDKGGELLLRETEIAIAKEHCRAQRQIVSTGGGVVQNKIVLDYFKLSDARVVYLDVSLSVIMGRLGLDEMQKPTEPQVPNASKNQSKLQKQNERPLAQNARELQALYHFRKPLYERYADHVVNTETNSALSIAKEIMNVLDAHMLVTI